MLSLSWTAQIETLVSSLSVFEMTVGAWRRWNTSIVALVCRGELSILCAMHGNRLNSTEGISSIPSRPTRMFGKCSLAPSTKSSTETMEGPEKLRANPQKLRENPLFTKCVIQFLRTRPTMVDDFTSQALLLSIVLFLRHSDCDT